MSEQLALGLTALLLVVVYVVVLRRVGLAIARTLANLIGSSRGQTRVDEDTGIEYDLDDEIAGYDEVETASGKRMEAYSRADARVRWWFYGVLFPIALYMHYTYWEAIVAGFEYVFQYASALILDTFYKETLINSMILVIASVAKQSHTAESIGWRLPRRYAPRNDE